MKQTIYLYRSGHLKRQDDSLVLIDKQDNKTYIPIQQIDQIICFAELDLNKRVISLLNQYGISILFYNFYGQYIGGYFPKERKNGKILFQQVQSVNDYQSRFNIAMKIIFSSIHNELAVIKYYRKKGIELEDVVRKLDNILNGLVRAKTIDDLLIYEAQAKQIYYLSFDRILNDEHFFFKNRSKNPPKNEVNALLSYGYSLLYAHYSAVLFRSSLHPQLSYIHSLDKSYDALKYDLSDIMKPVIVDRMVLRLIRKKQIHLDMFEFKEDGACYLNKKGVTFFAKMFDQQLHSTIIIDNKSYAYKSLISREVHLLSNYLKGKTKRYSPFLMRW